jgi:DNA helicase-2/ATP-dependent DNA helicase PcrA
MAYVQGKFRYVLIDEYQDINKSQYELIKLISAKHKNLFAVGDDAQSIYGFRYADISNILNFQKDFDAKIYKLEQNYRSSSTILNAANAVIKNNAGQIDKKLWTDNESGDKIVFHIADNEYDEASMVSSVIQGMIDYKNKRPRDFAILYRTNMLSRVMEERLLSNSIPCQVIGGTSFFERKEIKDMLAYMKVINNPNDSISLTRIINVPKRGIGDSTVDKIRSYMAETECSLFDVIQDITKVPDKITKKTQTNITELGDIMKDLIQFANAPGRRSEDIIRAIWEATGYVKVLEEAGTEEDLERVDNLDELLRIAHEYDKVTPEEERGLTTFLQSISLVSDLDSMDNVDVVKLMSVHAAKGLEFPYVFIIGMEEGIFPHGTAIAEGPAQVEEERRLFYVAITRAKERLYISMAIKRNLYFMDPDFIPKSKPSRFLSEIPKNLVVKV